MTLLAKDIDASLIEFAAPTVSGVVPIVIQDMPLTFQTPELVTECASSKGDICLSLVSERASVKLFMDLLKRIYERASEYGACDVGTSLVLSIRCPAYDSLGTEVPKMELQKPGWRVTAIVKCLGLWVIAGKAGLSWRVISVRADPPTACTHAIIKDERIDDFGDEVCVEMT